MRGEASMVLRHLPSPPVARYSVRMPSRLETLVAGYPSMLVGYSGGVDSTLLAVVCRRVLGRERMLAALGISASYPADQHAQALEVARAFDLPLQEVRTDELDDANYVANAPSRCYFCKRELWTKLGAVARERGIAVVADGTKADVRAEARALGIPVWDAPAAPCLSSRIRYGLSVTPGRLRQVEQGEALLRALGVKGDLRLRHWGEEARIEVLPSQFAVVRAHRDRVATGLLGLGFQRVALRLGGY